MQASTPTHAAPPRSISIVIPALNEENGIVGSVREVRKALGDRFQDWEIILVDDGSIDRTAAVMDGLAAEDPAHIRVLRNGRNLGLGGAYKRGVSAARCTHVMMVPGDDSHPAEGLTPILDHVGEADLILPYAVNPEARRKRRRIMSWGFTTLVNALFGNRVRYYNGLVVHRTELIKPVEIRTDGFAYQAEAVVKLLDQGHSYRDVGVLIAERDAGVSKAFRLRNVVKVSGTLMRLWAELRLGKRGSGS